MTKRVVGADEKFAKICLFLGSLVVGLVIGVLTYGGSQSIALGLAIGVIAAVGNPFVAALAVKVCEGLHEWAFPETYAPWSIEKRAGAGAAWPVVLGFWVIVSLFFAAINRLFS